MSDTPRTDAAEYESQDEPVAKLGSVDVDFARQLERELNAANDMFRKLNIHALNLTERIKRLEEENDAMRADLLFDTYPQTIVRELNRMADRIKRLEEAGDDLYANCDLSRWDSTETTARKLADQNAWRKAKESK